MDDPKDTPGLEGPAVTDGDNTGLDALASSAPNKEPIVDASDLEAENDKAPLGDVAGAKTLIENLEDDFEEGIEKVKEGAINELHKIEDKLGIKHGTYDAAKVGLQTDASGAYTPPTNPSAG